MLRVRTSLSQDCLVFLGTWLPLSLSRPLVLIDRTTLSDVVLSTFEIIGNWDCSLLVQKPCPIYYRIGGRLLIATDPLHLRIFFWFCCFLIHRYVVLRRFNYSPRGLIANEFLNVYDLLRVACFYLLVWKLVWTVDILIRQLSVDICVRRLIQ